MEMFCFGILGGVVFALITILFLMDKDFHDRDRSGDSDADDPVRECNGMDRDIPTPEEIEEILHTFRIGASQREKRVIEYLIDKEGTHEDRD